MGTHCAVHPVESHGDDGEGRGMLYSRPHLMQDPLSKARAVIGLFSISPPFRLASGLSTKPRPMLASYNCSVSSTEIKRRHRATMKWKMQLFVLDLVQIGKVARCEPKGKENREEIERAC